MALAGTLRNEVLSPTLSPETRVPTFGMPRVGLSPRHVVPFRIKIRLPDFGETPSVVVRVAIPSDPADWHALIKETLSGSALFPKENIEQPVAAIPKGELSTNELHCRTLVRWG